MEWLGADARAQAPWVVGFSGGADSLSLVLLLWAHWPEHRRKLITAHFNHCLRGRESALDAAFCRRVSHGLGLRHIEQSWLDKPEQVSEAAARDARHIFLDKARRRHRAWVIWTGHHADDVAETMLMRLGRGSGTAGLAAPRPIQAHGDGSFRLRPLIGLDKKTLTQRLTDAGAVWREDSSNAGSDFLRNRIRNEVMPAWRASAEGRQVIFGATLSRQLLEEDDAALEAWVSELVVLGPGPSLDLRRLLGRPRAIFRRALRLWLEASPYRGDLSRQGFEILLEKCERGESTRFSLGSQGFALIRRKVLSYEPVSLS